MDPMTTGLWIGAAWCGCWFVGCANYEIRKRISLPKIELDSVLFREDFVASFSCRNALYVILTADELRIQSSVPFFNFPDEDCCVARSRISSVTESRASLGRRQVNIRWKDEQGRPHLSTLILRNPDRFLVFLKNETLPPAPEKTLPPVDPHTAIGAAIIQIRREKEWAHRIIRRAVGLRDRLIGGWSQLRRDRLAQRRDHADGL